MDKPTKPTNLMPRSFGGVKNNWTDNMQTSGYEDGVPAIYGGDNLNYQLDATGKELDYCEKVIDFIVDIPVGKTITVDNNNKLVYGNSTPDVDNQTVNINASDKLQAIGVLDNRDNSTALKYWTGTRTQYDAILSKDSNTIYNITDDTDLTMTLLNVLYPVGAIYIGTMSTCPLAVLGIGTWQTVATDRVLQGSGIHSAGDTVEAGLPNITGEFGTDTAVDGAFYKPGGDRQGPPGGLDGTDNNVYFDASRSSSIYGNSTTVQPPAYVVNIWRRIG